jgi:predicted NUDIX family phosphoesterase
MEFVFVVERAKLFDLSYPHGFVPAAADREAAADRLERIRRHGFFVERRAAEQNSAWKQIIPYVVVRRGDTLLLLERKKKQGEARLHGKLSIGVGGHVNPVDHEGDAAASGDADVLLQGLRREIDEELHVRGRLELRAAGFLNDDATDVGAVHFGLVVVADAGAAEVSIRETELMDGRFLPRAELAALHAREPGRFESWSGLLLQELDAVLAAELSLEETFARRAAAR